MSLVSANLFAQPKHLQMQNPSCHQSRREMMSSENPFVSLGIAPWCATKLQMWTLALSSTGKIHSEISLGQQLLLNYKANSKENIHCSDSMIFQKAGGIRGIWRLRFTWAPCDGTARADLWGCGGEGGSADRSSPCCWYLQCRGWAQHRTGVSGVWTWNFTHVGLKVKGNWIFLGPVWTLGQKEWHHKFICRRQKPVAGNVPSD